MGHQTYHHTHRVTYAECTLGNHIYHSRYLDLLETARGEFFRHLGTTFLHWQEQHLAFPVIDAHLTYKAPARYDDLLTIELWLQPTAGIRIQFAYHILNQHRQPLVLATTTHVCSSTDDDKPKRPPAELLTLLQDYTQPAAK